MLCMASRVASRWLSLPLYGCRFRLVHVVDTGIDEAHEVALVGHDCQFEAFTSACSINIYATKENIVGNIEEKALRGDDLIEGCRGTRLAVAVSKCQ